MISLFKRPRRLLPQGGAGDLPVAMAALGLALLFGLMAGFSAYLPLVLLAGLLVALLLLSSPRATVWAILFGATVVAGLVELYVPKLQQVRWAIALMSIVLAIVALIQRLSADRGAAQEHPASSWLKLTLLLLPVSAVLGSIQGQLPLVNALVGFKNYFQMWGLVLALAWFGYSAAQARRFVDFLALLAIVQLPFVLHQFLVLVPLRDNFEAAMKGIVAVDIVGGTFGGDMNGGGRSPDLALLAAIVIVYCLALWRHGRMSFARAALGCLLAFSPIVLNEAKLAVVLVPVGLLILFKRNIIERPLAMLLGTVVVTALMAGLIVVYSLLPGESSSSLDGFVSDSISYNIGDRGYGNSVLNRSTVYSHWWREHIRRDDYLGLMFGHGPGASNEASATATDTLGRRAYKGYGIGLTAVSSVLWDLGLLGCVLVFIQFGAAYALAAHLSSRVANQDEAVMLTIVKIAVALAAISLTHNNFFNFDVGFQAICAVLFGYVLAVSRNNPERQR